VPCHDQPQPHSQDRPRHRQAPPAPLCRGTSRAERMREQRRKDKTERKRRETAKQDARHTKRMTSSARKEHAHTVRTSSNVDLCTVHRTVLPSPVHRRIIRESYVPHTSPESHPRHRERCNMPKKRGDTVAGTYQSGWWQRGPLRIDAQVTEAGGEGGGGLRQGGVAVREGRALRWSRRKEW